MSRSRQPSTRTRSPLLWLVLAGALLLLVFWASDPLDSCGAGSGKGLFKSASSQTTERSEPSKLPRGGRGGIASAEFPTRTWDVPADLFEYLQAHRRPDDDDPFDVDDDPFADNDPFAFASAIHGIRPMNIERELKSHGVPFGPGTFARLDLYGGKLTVCNKGEHLDWIGGIIEAIGPMKLWVLDESLFRSNDPPPDPRIQARIKANTEKLKTIVIPKVDFQETSVGDIFAFLEKRVRELEPSDEKTGLLFRIEEPDEHLLSEPGFEPIKLADCRIDHLRLVNVSVNTVLQYICDCRGIRYRIDEDGVTLLSIGARELVTRHWHVAEPLMPPLLAPQDLKSAGPTDPFSNAPTDAEARAIDQERFAPRNLIERLRENGISFPKGASIHYDETTTELTVTNTPTNQELVEALFTRLVLHVSRQRAGP